MQQSVETTTPEGVPGSDAAKPARRGVTSPVRSFGPVGLLFTTIAVLVAVGWGSPVDATGSDGCEMPSGYVSGCQMLQGRADGWFVPTAP